MYIKTLITQRSEDYWSSRSISFVNPIFSYQTFVCFPLFYLLDVLTILLDYLDQVLAFVYLTVDIESLYLQGPFHQP